MKKLLILAGLALALCSAEAQKPYKAYVVSNAHFDSQWDWTVQTSIATYLNNTVKQNFYLLENYPDYKFNFEGAVKYNWIKEYYPDDFERVKGYIKAGRWNVCGSSWDATDPNIPSSESMFRNIMLGQRFYMENFGVKSNDIFLPDCFGFGAQLPVIAAHAGLKGFSTQKLQWRSKPFYGDKKIPFQIGLWQGLDGSRLMAVMDACNYTTRWDDEDLSQNDQLKQLAENNNGFTYHYYGTGDIGGSPTIRSVMSVERGMKGEGDVAVVSASAGEMFDDFYPFDRHPELPVFEGELLMDVHATGCYTSQAAMKRFNRRNEQLADAAERASVAADLLGAAPYPADELRREWQRFVWHQFHDDLTGTSIPEVYPFSWNDELISQSIFASIIDNASGGVSRLLNTNTQGAAILVYNPSANSRNDLVEINVPASLMPANAVAVAPDGKQLPVQVIERNDQTVKAVFAASVAPVSYTVFDLREGTTKNKSRLSATEKSLENSIYKVTLDSFGDICSMKDKRNGRELVAKGKSFRLALFDQNESNDWPAWEIMKSTMDRQAVSVADNVKITVEELGCVRATLRVERTYGESRFVQLLSLTDGGADDCLTITNLVDWNTSNALLKAEFNTSLSTPKATYDMGVGNIVRGNNTETQYEVFAQQWADVSSGNYGISIVNDCKYGWDKPDNNTLRLTLIHTPSAKQNRSYQVDQDKGHHRFAYGIVAHRGSSVEKSGVVAKADRFNNPLTAYMAPKHDGMGRSYSLVSSSTPQIAVKAVKQAESGEGYVVRVNEVWGKEAKSVRLTFPTTILSAATMNGIEEPTGTALTQGNTLTFDSRPFAPSTFFVKLKRPDIQASSPKSQFVDLPCNKIAFTNDAFNRQGRFDRHGNSYAAELVPDTIISNGIAYSMANDVEQYNCVSCKGQTIALPSMSGKLHLLVAADDTDRNVTFKIGDKSYEVDVPYYSGFYGQWGHTGQTEGYVKDAELAFVGTHRHNRTQGNEPYVLTYMFHVVLPVQGADSLTLPNEEHVSIFAATMSDSPNDCLTPMGETRALPLTTKPVEYKTSEQEQKQEQKQ